MGSTLIFNQFENGKFSHNSFFSSDLKLQNMWSCHFKKYGKMPQICCVTNFFLLCILLYSTSDNHITVLDARLLHLLMLKLLITVYIVLPRECLSLIYFLVFFKKSCILWFYDRECKGKKPWVLCDSKGRKAQMAGFLNL